MTSGTLYKVRDLHFSYAIEGQLNPVLRGLSMQVESGDMVAIKGPSGSGKSTFLYLLSGLLKPQSGVIEFGGKDLTRLSADELSLIRNQHMGFVFQQFHLLPRLSVLENVLLSRQYDPLGDQKNPQTRERAHKLIRDLGLESVILHRPNQLSGGQQQRVAIARALMGDPQVILADEPTGNLDSTNAQQILDILKSLNEQGKTIIIITHDSDVAKMCKRTLELRDGLWTNPSHTAGSPHTHIAEIKTHIPAVPHPLRSMRWALPLAIKNLSQNKTRSFLTLLGITIGIASVLSMLTLGNFTKHAILSTYEVLGVNQVSLYAHPNWFQRASDKVSNPFRELDYQKDILPLFSIFPSVKYASPIYETGVESVTSGGRIFDERPQLMGVNEYYQYTNEQVLFTGHYFSAFHIKNRSSVCVIGYNIAEKLFTSNPLGKLLVFSPRDKEAYSCRVIGVLEKVKSKDQWNNANSMVLIPHSLFPLVVRGWGSRLHRAALTLHKDSDVESVAKAIQGYFEKKYSRSGQFDVGSFAILITQMTRALNAFVILLGGIAVISLVVGGMGITNMMLVSVVERFREIGLRKALGATRQDIRNQFLLESIFLCTIAGILGVGIGFFGYEAALFVGSMLFKDTIQFEWTTDFMALALSFGAIFAVGLLSGLFPAMKADRLSVIEALRSE